MQLIVDYIPIVFFVGSLFLQRHLLCDRGTYGGDAACAAGSMADQSEGQQDLPCLNGAGSCSGRRYACFQKPDFSVLETDCPELGNRHCLSGQPVDWRKAFR